MWPVLVAVFSAGLALGALLGFDAGRLGPLSSGVASLLGEPAPQLAAASTVAAGAQESAQSDNEAARIGRSSELEAEAPASGPAPEPTLHGEPGEGPAAVSSEALDAAAAISLEPPVPPAVAAPVAPLGGLAARPTGLRSPLPVAMSPPVRGRSEEQPAGHVHIIYEEAERPAPPSREPVDPAGPVARQQSAALSGAPTGPLSEQGRPLWQANAVSPVDPAGRPMIAVVFDDLGLNRPNTRRVMALTAPLTLSFMTYADDLGRMTAQARAAGHELMVHVPMEPMDASLDPGERVLRAGRDPDEILRRLTWGLERFSGYVGINNHMGSRFTAETNGMAVVLAELKRRGLLFLDSKTAVRSVGAGLADRFGVPFIARDIFIDNNPEDRAALRRQLERLETLARRRGAAVGIGHPHSATIEVLKPWLATLEDRGFVLVPISALVRRRIHIAEEADSAG